MILPPSHSPSVIKPSQAMRVAPQKAGVVKCQWSGIANRRLKKKEQTARIAELIKSIDFCMLITINKTGGIKMAKKSNTRTAQGSGSIRQRPDGRWEARYTVGHDPGTGKQIRKSKLLSCHI